MLRVGVDEFLTPELVKDFPRDAEIVYIPRDLNAPLEVDFLILAFHKAKVKAMFSHLRGVKVVQSLMAGVDWITPWLPGDVVLCDGRGLHDISTSEWVLAAILATMKRFQPYAKAQIAHTWEGQASRTDGFLSEPGANRGLYGILSEDLSDKTVLILGYGSIGSAIEKRLEPFGVKVLRVARTAKEGPKVHAVGELHQLLPLADIVVAILPLTAETRGLIGASKFDLMRPGALFINAARGPVVDTSALIAALEEHRIRAVLDVTDPEPLAPDHPLWDAPNCLITPHVAGSTPEFIHRAFRFANEQVRRYLAGQPLENRVTESGY